MPKLSLDDRIAVYGYFGKITGHVYDVFRKGEHTFIHILEDGFYSCHNDGPFHEKQCRKLIKKKKVKKNG